MITTEGVLERDLVPSYLPIPEEGLKEVLRAWSGRGELLAAMAGVADDGVEVTRRWTVQDVRRRAHRVLFAKLEPLLLAWPDSERVWLEALPAEIDRALFTSPLPRSGIIWTETRRRHGWPPIAFSGRERSRVPDQLMAQTFAWTITRLGEIESDSTLMEPRAAERVSRQLATARRVFEGSAIAMAAPVLPDASDLRYLQREGSPWNVLARVAEQIRVADRSVEYLAREILFPDPELRPRLFHLAVLGVVLRSSADLGCTVTSMAPLSGPRSGPSYHIVDKIGRQWDLWFEAAGAWGHYGIDSPYGNLIRGIRGRASSLSPDIALILPGKRALLIECKYSSQPDYVGRRGLTQVMAYAAEFATSIETVTALVVAPEGVVHTTTWENMVVGAVGLTGPEDLVPIIAKELKLDAS